MMTEVSIKLSVLGAFLLFAVLTGAEEKCGFILSEGSGEFRTPNFPQLYPNGMECLWKITVKSGHYVALSFHFMEVESYKGKCIDVVEVKDGEDISSELLGSFCTARRPPKVITSSGNALRVWFYSDESDQSRGFNATYTSYKEECGGDFTEPSGTITSPRFGLFPYPSNQDCTWTVTVPRDQFVRLSVGALKMEFECSANKKRSCSCVDKLEIWDGAEGDETKLGTYCVAIKQIMVSKTNRLKLRFTSNKEGRFYGFQMFYTTSSTPGCGGDLRGDRGSVFSPNYPSTFPAFSDCVWRLETTEDKYMSLRFPQFYGINGTTKECATDTVEIRDGYSRHAPLLGSYCSQNLPPVLVSSGNQLYIYLRSRQTKVTPQDNRFFRAIYLTHSRECNASLGMADGRIRDTQLSASSNSIFRVGLAQFFLAPRFGRLNGPYGWCSQSQRSSMAADEYFQIEFSNLTLVTAIATQGHYVQALNSWGIVGSFKVEYSFGGTSYWVPYNDPRANNSNGEFTVFKGNTNPTTPTKNVFAIPIIASVIRIKPLTYASYPIIGRMCLRAEVYGCPYTIDCGGTFTALKPGMISIRGSPDKPRDCTWVSKPTSPAFAGLVMLIRFAYFDVPCNHGKVVLHDRVSGAKNELCGADLPPEYTIRASSQLLVTVSLKAGIDVAGVDINYKAETFGCGDVILAHRSGNLTSPDYPKPYKKGESCTWLLAAGQEETLTLHFNDFELHSPNGSKCPDYLEVRDGQLETSVLLGKFCGKAFPKVVSSTARYLRIKFHNDDRGAGNGFHLTYRVVRANEAETQPNNNSSSSRDTGMDAAQRESRFSAGVGLKYPPPSLLMWVLAAFLITV